MISLIFILMDVHVSAFKGFSIFATYLEFLFCLLMEVLSGVSFSTQIVSLIKQVTDTLGLSFSLNL